MNPVTKNDLNAALQQMTNIIVTKTASVQDVQNVVQNTVQRFCTKQDIINIVNSSREAFLERVTGMLREQQVSLLAQLEITQRRMAQLEAKLDAARSTMQDMQSELHNSPTHVHAEPDRDKPVFHDYFSNK